MSFSVNSFSFQYQHNGRYFATLSKIKISPTADQVGVLVIVYDDDYLRYLDLAVIASVGVFLLFTSIGIASIIAIGNTGTSQINTLPISIPEINNDKEDVDFHLNFNDNSNGGSNNSKDAIVNAIDKMSSIKVMDAHAVLKRNRFGTERETVDIIRRAVFDDDLGDLLGGRQLSQRILNLLHIPQLNVARMVFVPQVVVVLALICIFAIWYFAVTLSYNLLVDSTIGRQEYLHLQDTLFNFFDSTEMILSVIKLETRRREAPEMQSDEFYYLMKSFVDFDGTYLQYYIYSGTSSGEFYGTSHISVETEIEADEQGLYIGIRDNSTNWDYIEVSPNISYYNLTKYSILTDFDPRCRDWYINGILYTFAGSLEQAFPNTSIYNSWEYFFENKNDAWYSDDCTYAREVYTEIWGIKYDEIEEKYYGTINKTKTIDIAWTKYIFAKNEYVGYTAVSCISDQDSGILIGCFGVDYSIDDINLFLEQSVGHFHMHSTSSNATEEEDVSYAWIFEASSNDSSLDWYEIIASSNSLVLTTLNDELVSYNALNHPTDVIRINSELIVSVQSIDSLPINGSKLVDTAWDQPLVEGGRITYGSSGKDNGGLSWIVMRSIDTFELTVAIFDDFGFRLFVSIFAVIVFWFLIDIIRKSIIVEKFGKLAAKYAKSRDDATNDKKIKKKNQQQTTTMSDLLHNQNESKQAKLEQIRDNMEEIVVRSSNNVWEKELDDCNYSGIVTMSQVRQYISQRVYSVLSRSRINSDELNLEMKRAWYYQVFLQIFSHDIYNTFIQFVIILHIHSAVYEPITQEELFKYGWGTGLIVYVFILMLIEWFDLGIQFIKRYIQIRVIKKHLGKVRLKKVCFSKRVTSPHYIRFLSLIVINCLILINFVFTITIRIGFFSYYVPITPVLLLIKNTHIWNASRNVVSALIRGKDVFLIYTSAICVASVIGVSLFENDVNPDTVVNNYAKIPQAIVSTYVHYLHVFFFVAS